MKNNVFINHDLYVNRELSWLDFNDRVLQEAECRDNPLLERIKFLGIFSNNQDEFFRVRVATLKRIVKFRKKSEYEYNRYYSPEKILAEITRRIVSQQKRLLFIYKHITRELATAGIHIINEKEIKHPEHHAFMSSYFDNKLRTFVFPIMMKNFNPETILRDKSIYLGVELKHAGKNTTPEYALIEVPSDPLTRFVVLPEIKGNKYVMFIDDIIRYNLKSIFRNFNHDLSRAFTIKFTRDAELEIDNDISKSFMEIISDSLKQRKTGNPVRFVIDKDMPSEMLKYFSKRIGITHDDTVVFSGRYHNFKDLMSFPDLGNSSLKFPPQPAVAHARLDKARSIFAEVKKKDVMLNFPYQSFRYVIDFLREASIDPAVRSIKMTIYRIGKNSNVINALINAARNGKNVTVFMELQARFDEENNIYWSTRLQEEGVRVIHSIPGLKVHAKLILVKRTEGRKEEYYTNIGTGNFNEATASTYCDVSIMTANQRIGHEVDMVFEMFEASYRSFDFSYLHVSPLGLRDFTVKMLDELIDAASKGQEAYAIIKLNNIVDENVANKIYQAAHAGVKIDVIARGMCVLQPLKDNLRIRSIVGRYLEHSRVIYYKVGKVEHMYITSADWMKRNLDHRIEILCPVLDKDARKVLKRMLDIQLADNVKARFVNGKSNNVFITDSNPSLLSQDETYRMFVENALKV
ncbi:MAG: polyphosphate kinase 1 [Bacteroidetes bacterium HGW-Bacteroidetes-6]|jgi:polyphosphate kinase|nr:MAG: polyphosphate kinase 1 [Bacteroidetes bacterium HGW-Bacteroidetes-6]